MRKGRENKNRDLAWRTGVWKCNEMGGEDCGNNVNIVLGLVLLFWIFFVPL